MQNSAQYHDLAPLDGKHKRGRACIGMLILLALEEEPWCRPNSFQAILETNLHNSWEWEQSEFLKPVVEAIVDIAETGVDNPNFEQH